MKSLASNSTSSSSSNSHGQGGGGGGASAQLSPPEVTAVRQLIAGYRESAAFLLRSADELENLILQQNWELHTGWCCPSLINTHINAHYDRKGTCSYVHLHTYTPKAQRQSLTPFRGSKMEGSEEAVSETHIQGTKLRSFTSHNNLRFTGHEPVFCIIIFKHNINFYLNVNDLLLLLLLHIL